MATLLERIAHWMDDPDGPAGDGYCPTCLESAKHKPGCLRMAVQEAIFIGHCHKEPES